MKEEHCKKSQTLLDKVISQAKANCTVYGGEPRKFDSKGKQKSHKSSQDLNMKSNKAETKKDRTYSDDIYSSTNELGKLDKRTLD